MLWAFKASSCFLFRSLSVASNLWAEKACSIEAWVVGRTPTTVRRLGFWVRQGWYKKDITRVNGDTDSSQKAKRHVIHWSSNTTKSWMHFRLSNPETRIPELLGGVVDLLILWFKLGLEENITTHDRYLCVRRDALLWSWLVIAMRLSVGDLEST